MEQVKHVLRSLIASLDGAQWVALLLARLALGIEFMISGYGKLFTGRLPELIETFESWDIRRDHHAHDQ